MAEGEKTKKGREEAFVEYALGRMKSDHAFGAALRRADNPATEYRSWEHLWCDIEKSWERRPFAIIAAAMARAKPSTDGFLGIGKAIAECYRHDGGNKSESAKSKLRRLLACDSAEEACAILRPLLSLIASKGVSLSYAQLLKELVYFGEGKKLKWAADFYGRRWDDDRNGAQVESC